MGLSARKVAKASFFKVCAVTFEVLGNPASFSFSSSASTFVGIVPVVIGMLFYPAMRRMGTQGLNFALALTVGLLTFLFADSLKEAIELAVNATPAFQGIVMVGIVAAQNRERNGHCVP
jgi:hypothetical protein